MANKLGQTTDLAPTLQSVLKPLVDSLATVDTATSGVARDFSNYTWEAGGRHQTMEIGTTQRKLDDWVKSWGDSSSAVPDDSPGVVKCLCQLREHQDELARYNQASEAMAGKLDSMMETITTVSTRVHADRLGQAGGDETQGAHAGLSGT